MVTFISSVLIFGLLIFFHELGHYAVAKLVGIRVHEFSIGFGPKIFGLTKGETVYNCRVFPLGGYVRMAGMDPTDEEEKNDERGFNKKPVLQRIAVILAGPLMNFLLAVILIAVIFIFQGIPTATTTEIGNVLAGKPAAVAGLKAGDKITSVNGAEVKEWTDLVSVINENPGKELSLDVLRDGNKFSVNVIPKEDDTGRGLIGIEASHTQLKKLNPFEALWSGVKYTVEFTTLILVFLGKMITNQAPADLGGPVRIVSEIGKAAQFGFFTLLQLAAFLSINLGLLNLIPIPALDGSRIMFLTIEGVRGKPVDPAKENFIHLIGFGLLLFLMVIITYKDIIQLL